MAEPRGARGEGGEEQGSGNVGTGTEGLRGATSVLLCECEASHRSQLAEKAGQITPEPDPRNRHTDQ